ncbi:hypothetical protein [Kitasatospora sp. NPDC096140]|uniref:hypothetical protein n=1 Tax=Kitasatospora sp. NPDC096140 TaxID=3155425 RepID=UPI00331DFC29
MDAVRVSALRERLAGTGWPEAVGGFAGALRRSVQRRGADALLLVGTEAYEPWHLAAHLADEAAWSAVPRLAPTLLRHRPPAGAPAHLAHDLRRLTGAGRGATVLVVAPEAAGAPLLERVHDARRHGATVLALDGADPTAPGDLGGLAHERLAVGTAAEEPFDLAQHLVSAAAGRPPGRRSTLDRLADLAGRLTAAPGLSRW